MNEHRPLPNYACKQSRIMHRTNSQKSTPYDWSLHHSMSPKNTMTHPQSKSTRLLQRISPCFTSMMPPKGSQLTGGPDIFKNQTQSMKTNSLLRRMEPRDLGPSPLSARGLPRNELL